MGIKNAPSGLSNAEGLRTVWFGHSYVDQEVTSGTGIINALRANGSFNWANALLDQPMTLVKEFGIGGFRLLDMISHYIPKIENVYNPDIVLMSLGHNDIKGVYPYGGGGSPAVPQIGEDIHQVELPYLKQKLIDFLSSVKKSTLFCLIGENPSGIDPSNALSPVSSPQFGVRMLQWNKILQSMPSRFSNVIYIPAERGIIDPAHPNAANFRYWDHDQTHPSILGAYHRGFEIASYLSRVLPMHVDKLSMSVCNTHTNCKILTASPPSGDGTVLTLPLTGNAFGSYRHLFEVGDWIQVQPSNLAEKNIAGRYQIIESSDTCVRVLSSYVGTAVNNMYISNADQMFINPLLLQTTGGGLSNSGVSGTIVGTLPLGVNISNLQAPVTVTVSLVPHLRRDGRTGFGNWLKLAVSAASGTNSFDISFSLSSYILTPSTYDVGRKLHLGQIYQAGMEVKQENATGGYNGYELRHTRQTMNETTEALDSVEQVTAFRRDPTDTPNNSSHKFPLDNHRVTLMTPEWHMPLITGKKLGLSSMSLRVYYTGASTVDLFIARPSVWAVDNSFQAAQLGLSTD